MRVFLGTNFIMTVEDACGIGTLTSSRFPCWKLPRTLRNQCRSFRGTISTKFCSTPLSWCRIMAKNTPVFFPSYGRSLTPGIGSLPLKRIFTQNPFLSSKNGKSSPPRGERGGKRNFVFSENVHCQSFRSQVGTMKELLYAIA